MEPKVIGTEPETGDVEVEYVAACGHIESCVFRGDFWREDVKKAAAGECFACLDKRIIAEY